MCLRQRWILKILAAFGLSLGVSLSAAHAQPSPTIKQVFEKYCIECHGAVKPRAKLNVLDRELLVNKKKVVTPNKPDDSELLARIISTGPDQMPPEEKKQKPTKQEIDVVRAWIAAGAQDFTVASVVPPPPKVVTPPKVELPGTEPKDLPKTGLPPTLPPKTDVAKVLREPLDTEYVLTSILQDERKLDADTRRFARYFSIAHLLNAGADEATLTAQRDALAKAMNHLSWRRNLAAPTPIEKTQTVLRIDLRNYGWDREVLKPSNGGAGSCNCWDMVLLEYPYGMMYNGTPTYTTLAREYLLATNMARPVPFVRADWFVSTATVAPLYHELLFLPKTLQKLEDGIGVNSQANLTAANLIRAGLITSGVSVSNRVVERQQGSFGYYWRSYDYASSSGKGNMNLDPVHLQPDGGEMIFQLPNGLQGYLIVNKNGERLDEAPTAIVADHDAHTPNVRTGLSCIRCHSTGMKGFTDTVRSTVQSLTGNPTAFDRNVALQLYPEKATVDRVLKQDETAFQAAMQKLLGKQPEKEPVTIVSDDYVEKKLTTELVTAELGMKQGRNLKDTFGLPQFAAAGLSPLASGKDVPRDAFEKHFPEIVRQMGLGAPVVPLDAETNPNYEPLQRPFRMTVKAGSKADNVAKVGDDLQVFLLTDKDVFVEVIYTTADGKPTIVTPAGTQVKANETFRAPISGVKVSAKAAKEQITVLASEVAFTGGEVLNGFGVPNRVIHRSGIQQENGRMVIETGPDPFRSVKKTVTLEVR